MKTVTQTWRALLAIVLVAACVRMPEAPPPAARPEAPAALPSRCVPPAEPAGGQLLTIDRGDSVLRILIHRGGQLARLGHNHVIASRDLWGYAVLARTLTASRFVLCVPVNTLVVDDPQLRAAAGEEFASELSDAAVAGTRRNMLSPAQLDGAVHPFIVVLGRIVGGTPPQATIELKVYVRDTVHTVPVTVQFEQAAQGVIASGSLELRQTDLGVRPYSALFGALTVRDQFAIHFRLRATAAAR